MRRWRRGAIADGLTIASVLLFGIVLCSSAMTAYRRAGWTPTFYQENFQAAVFFACTGEFGTMPWDTLPEELRRFLTLGTDTFSCASLGSRRPVEDGQLVRGWYYLLRASALVWAVFGISWVALDRLLAVLFGLTLVAAYFVFRLGASRPLALLGTVFFAASTSHLWNLYSLRDYSKAPFVLAALACTGAAVVRRLSDRALFVLALAVGVLCGVGAGFRADALVVIPLFVVAVLAFLPAAGWKRGRRNGALAATCVGAFLLASLPTRSNDPAAGSCTWHFFLLGFSPERSAELGVTPAAYDWVHQFNDALINAQVNGFAASERQSGDLGFCTRAYDVVSRELYFGIASAVPADLLTRGLASTMRVFESAFSRWPYQQPPALTNPVLRALVTERARLSAVPDWIGPVTLVAAAAVTAAYSVRLAVFMSVAVLYLGAYPSLQFSARHAFHLEVLSIWPALFLLDAALGRRWRQPLNPRRTIYFAAGMTAAIAGTSLVLGTMQQRELVALAERLESAKRQPVPLVSGGNGDSRVFAWPHELTSAPYAFALMRVEIDGTCPEGAGFRIGYESTGVENDLGRTMRARAAPGERTVVYVPVYFAKDRLRPSEFGSSEGIAPCVRSLDRLTSGQQFAPMTLTLAGDWRAGFAAERVRWILGD